MKTSIKTSGIKRLGKAIRFHSQFHPKGTNVNFVDIISNDMISMRTYERGVECETYACGTGAIACSIISHVIRKIEHPLKVRTFSNEILSVDFKESEGRFTDVTLTGPAITTFDGEILI
jgi:diaminopimelate epimerase